MDRPACQLELSFYSVTKVTSFAIFFLFVGFNLCPQMKNIDLKDIEGNSELFFDALRQMEIEEAEFIIAKISSGGYKKLAKALIDSYKGKKSDIRIDSTGLNVDSKLVWLLQQGHQANTEFAENAVKAFQSFAEAIHLADSRNRQNALKFSLISMLDLLQKQAFLSDKSFMPYLDHYREIVADIYDERMLTLLEVRLKANEDENLKGKFQGYEVIQRLDSLFKNVNDSSAMKAHYYYGIGIQYKLVKDYGKAMNCMRRAQAISAKKKEIQTIYETAVWQISSLYLGMNQLDSALVYWKESASLSKKLRNKWYNERLASWIYHDLGKMDSAYHYLNESIVTGFNLEGRQQRFQSSLLAVHNETEKLKLDKLRLDNRRKTSQNYFLGALSLLVIGTITAISIQKNTAKKRQLAEQATLLEQQKVATLLKEQELVSIDAMIAGQEKERTKVANELHDDLGSLMATVKLHFDNVKVDKQDPALKSAQDLLEKAYQKIRGMAHAKNSGVMADQGLLPAVQKMAQIISETNALEIGVEDFGLGDRMENSLELTIFRILQELVANIIKHAEATKASIQFTQHEDKLNIIVEDNGMGFEMGQAKMATSGMGLTTIEKRIEHLGGSFTVDSILGKGTSILIDIPV